VKRIWVLALSAGVFAGLAAWLGGEGTLDHFSPALEWRIGKVDAVYRLKPTSGSLRVAATKNAALGFGILGGALGLALGAAGAFAGRAPRRAFLAGLTGLTVGALVEAAVTFVAVPQYYRAKDLDRSQDDLPLALRTHAGIWSLAGAAGGLAFGLGMGRGGFRRTAMAAVGGMMGAGLGAVVFELLGAVTFPIEAYTAEPISNTPGSRFLARLLVAVGTAIGVAIASGHAAIAVSSGGIPSDSPAQSSLTDT
jgi:hypothetical protein